MLRFLIGGDGIAQDVLVIESTLGNYDVERCLVEVGRRIAFHAPTGHKATTFEYPVEFRSTNQLAVLDVDGLKIDHDLSVFLPQLAACGQLAAEDANAIIYIEPTGSPARSASRQARAGRGRRATAWCRRSAAGRCRRRFPAASCARRSASRR